MTIGNNYALYTPESKDFLKKFYCKEMANVWGNKHASPDETKYTCIETTGGPLIYITVMLLCMNWNTEKEIDEGAMKSRAVLPFTFKPLGPNKGRLR